MNISIILGTRPEIIKLSPIIRKLEEDGINFFIIHTGQHYSYGLDQIFIEQLKLPKARFNLNIGSSSHAVQTGYMLTGIEKILIDERPDIVLVQGDTNTVLAGALCAAKLGIDVGHVEAGLRSYDRNMPEEINRVLTDHCSSLLFAPTEHSFTNLINEGISKEKIYVTGNTIVDAVHQNLKMAYQFRKVYDELNLEKGNYILTTIHRQENVDSQDRFSSILKGLELLSCKLDLPIIYPIHPRAKKMMNHFNLNTKLELINPVDYFTFLNLQNNAKLILTDSGGVQEEACILGVPCVTLRDNTERPETIQVGANIIAGVEPQSILSKAKRMLKTSRKWKNPFGLGNTGTIIVDILKTVYIE